MWCLYRECEDKETTLGSIEALNASERGSAWMHFSGFSLLTKPSIVSKMF